ncbi:hypothetical protein OG921_04770 [Aldersonia sp. NBC_00410]|uniref:esterase/lipase family protein n=1 Tax=Aldersonia sp. NBC_00410 TaxID=2975954 RepID=UPI00225B8CE1|nr:hypothetical protein [Aldersonia sp. NBC_00410]MCX5042485.1 hypothetical protein [Aldersonia sp. NBC_00410]
MTRLVVFVHGFNGRAISTWRNVAEASEQRQWWRQADLLFVGYPSLKDNVTAVAHRLRRELPRFYPHPFAEAMYVSAAEHGGDAAGGVRPRENVDPYDELLMVGHSLGGLIVRRALCDEAAELQDVAHSPGRTSRRGLLDAQVRLFSPASAGFRAAGFLGFAKAFGVWAAVEPFLRRASAYTDLQPGSVILTETRTRTENLVAAKGYDALRPRIVWASPDDVVIGERYSTDWVDSAWDGRTHTSVCKSSAGRFERPWDFIETGRP